MGAEIGGRGRGARKLTVMAAPGVHNDRVVVGPDQRRRALLRRAGIVASAVGRAARASTLRGQFTRVKAWVSDTSHYYPSALTVHYGRKSCSTRTSVCR